MGALNTRAPTILLAGWTAAAWLPLLPLVFGLGGLSLDSAAATTPARLLHLAANSLALGFLAALLATAVGLPIALAAARLEPRPRSRLLLGLGSLPLFVPPTVLAVAAIRLFGPAGFLTDLLGSGPAAFPAVEQIRSLTQVIPGAPIYTIPGAALTLGIAFSPLSMLAAYAVLCRVSRDTEQAARLDASAWGVLRRISLPLAFGGIAAGACAVFLLALTEFGVPESLRSLPVLVSEVYVQFGVFYETRAALAAALLLLALAAAALLATAWIARRADVSLDPASEEADSPEAPPRGGVLSLLRVAGWVLAALPALVIAAVLLATATGPQGPFAVWRTVFQTAHDELAFTLLLAAGLALLCGLAGLALGYALARLRQPFAPRLLTLSPLIIPGPVYGVALTVLLRRPPGSLPLGLDGLLAALSETHAPLLYVWTLRFAPIAALIIERSVRAIPSSQWEAARAEGAGLPGLLRWVVLPAAWPGLLGGMLIAFALCLGEVGAAVLLLPPGPTTLGVRLLTLMHYAPTGQVSALCLMNLLPGLLAAALAALLLLTPRLARH